MATLRVIKNYSPENGLSATFRQWRAKSHCRFIHGYALGVEVTFECDEDCVDDNGWVFDFGGLKGFKQWLKDTFDHKTLVAKDDPALDWFKIIAGQHVMWKQENGPLVKLVEVERTGCEGFAKMIGQYILDNVLTDSTTDRTFGRTPLERGVTLASVKVYEHTGNSATWIPE